MNIKASFNGFNVYANRDSPMAFVDSYVARFPERKRYIEVNLPEALEYASVLLENPTIKQKTYSTTLKSKKKRLKRNQPAEPVKEWIPYSHYIPDNPHPMRNYKRQATNIARSMREAIDSQTK